MNIAIITFHFPHNHGAVLQCYALQQYLKTKGNDVKIIDYRPRYHTVRYTTYKNPFLYAQMHFYRAKKKLLLHRILITLQSFFKCLVLNIKRTDADSEINFTAFRNKNLNLTRKYETLEELQENPPIANVYITGSDQLWNTDILYRDYDEAYFLNFGSSSITRISYAVSLKNKTNENDLKRLKELCCRLDAISIREQDKNFENCLDKNVEICIDPTLFLTMNDYIKVQGQITEKEPYIFVYGLETTNDIREAVTLAAKKYNCKIINGAPHRVNLGVESQNAFGFGPDIFLAYIANATCVVTNSFHGTVFSIIYNKNFITVSHSTRWKRITELLQKLNLNQRLWGHKDFSIDKNIDWGKTFENLEMLKKSSEKFLISSIEEVKKQRIDVT